MPRTPGTLQGNPPLSIIITRANFSQEFVTAGGPFQFMQPERRSDAVE